MIKSCVQELTQLSAGPTPRDKNLKKLITLRGPIVIHKNHTLAKSGFHFSITPCLQELICYFGMLHTYSMTSRIIEKVLGICVTAKQVERVCTYYGQLLYHKQAANGLVAKPIKPKATTLYVLFDGSFVHIRNTSLPDNVENIKAHKDNLERAKTGPSHRSKAYCKRH